MIILYSSFITSFSILADNPNQEKTITELKNMSPEERANYYKKLEEKINQGSEEEKKAQEIQESKEANQEIADMLAEGQAKKLGIGFTTSNILNGQAWIDIQKILGFKENNEKTSVLAFIQDIIRGATMFIGTVVTVALVLSGAMYVFSTVDSGLKAKAKDGIKYSLIGMILVVLSLVIIRLVQFLAAGGS